MADVKFTPQFDDSQVQAALARLANNVDEVQAAANEMGDSVGTAMEKAATSANNLDKRLESAIKSLDANKVALKGADDSAKSFDRTIIGAAKNIKVFGVSINDVQQLLGKKRAQLKAVGTGLRSVNGLLKAFKVALAATGVGALVLALGSLVSLLTRTQKGVDFVNKTIAQARATVDVFVDRLSSLGEIITSVFSGEKGLREAAKEAKDAFSGITKEIRSEIKAVGDLEDASTRLRDRQRELNEETARRQRIIERLRNESRDENLTLEERAAKLREVLQIENDLESKRIELAKENLRIIEQRNALGESLAEDLDNESQARIDLDNISTESERRRREDISQLQTLERQGSEARQAAIKAETERINELTKQYSDLINSLNTAAGNAQFDLLSPFQKLEADRGKAIAQVDKLKTEIQAKANELGRDLPPTFEKNIQLLYSEINRAFVEEAQELNGRLEQLSIIPPGLEKQSQEEARRAVQGTFEAITIEIEKQRPTLDALYSDILEGLGISEDQAGQILSQAAVVFDNINEIRDANLQLEFNRIDALISKREESISELQRQLSAEQQLKAAGNANDVKAIQDKLTQERNILEGERRERQELERKAANRQLVVDSLLTASQYTLAAAKLAVANAGAGVIGLVAALGGLAILTRIISTAKTNAANLSGPEQLRKGKKLEGPSHENNGIPLNVEGRWYEAEGGEYLIGTAPSKEHDRFLANLNDRKYDNIPLLEIAENARKSRLGPMVRNTKAESKKFRESQAEASNKAITKAIEKQTEEIKKELEKRPIYYNKIPGAELFRQWVSGSKDKII